MNRLEIRRIAANTAAFYSNLRVGDYILTVNGINSANWTIAQAEQYFTTINVADITYSRKPEVVDLVDDDEGDGDDFEIVDDDDEDEDENEDEEEAFRSAFLHYSRSSNHQQSSKSYC